MNALEEVQAIRVAQKAVLEWSTDQWFQIIAMCPRHVLEHGQSVRDWAVTVELLRRDWETHIRAAERLALYLDLHRERYSDTPTLAAIRTTHRQETPDHGSP